MPRIGTNERIRLHTALQALRIRHVVSLLQHHDLHWRRVLPPRLHLRRLLGRRLSPFLLLCGLPMTALTLPIGTSRIELRGVRTSVYIATTELLNTNPTSPTSGLFPTPSVADLDRVIVERVHHLSEDERVSETVGRERRRGGSYSQAIPFGEFIVSLTGLGFDELSQVEDCSIAMRRGREDGGRVHLS
jgi:hypothetical protein